MTIGGHASASPLAAVASIASNRRLIVALVKRDFLGRYRGSVMGVAWSLFNPLLMLAIYTFVFSVVFQTRWGVEIGSKVSFAIVLFVGIIVHGLFAECLNRAPSLIVDHANYVKKVVFPLEVLPLVVLASAILHFVVSMGVLVLACAFAGIGVKGGVAWTPVVLLPLLLVAAGLGWLLASLGVYLRDLAQGIGILTNVLLFVSPVFYPVEALPEAYRWVLELNPLTMPITQLRNAVLWGTAVDWGAWTACLGVGIVVFGVGFWWFQRTRKGFADVL